MKRNLVCLFVPDIFVHPKIKDLTSDVLCIYITAFAIGVEEMPERLRVSTIQTLIDAGLGDFEGEKFIIRPIENAFGMPLIWATEEELFVTSAKGGAQ